jgi:hypothetical protein
MGPVGGGGQRAGKEWSRAMLTFLLIARRQERPNDQIGAPLSHPWEREREGGIRGCELC